MAPPPCGMISFRFGKRSNTFESISEMIAMLSSLMNFSVYDSRGEQLPAEWTSAGMSSSHSFSYSGYQNSSPSPGGGAPSPSVGSGFSRQPMKPCSLTRNSSSGMQLTGL